MLNKCYLLHADRLQRTRVGNGHRSDRGDSGRHLCLLLTHIGKLLGGREDHGRSGLIAEDTLINVQRHNTQKEMGHWVEVQIVHHRHALTDRALAQPVDGRLGVLSDVDLDGDVGEAL